LVLCGSFALTGFPVSAVAHGCGATESFLVPGWVTFNAPATWYRNLASTSVGNCQSRKSRPVILVDAEDSMPPARLILTDLIDGIELRRRNWRSAVDGVTDLKTQTIRIFVLSS
jgi:hypothetical protein